MEDRIKILNQINHKSNVLYLMNRDQRIYENHSVNLGYNLSYESKANFFIGLDFSNLKMNERQRIFVLEALAELKDDCKSYSLPFYIINNLEEFINDFNIDCIILDFSPLREIRERDEKIVNLCKSKKIGLYLCDSHNIVPCWMLKVYKRTSKAVKTDLYKLYNKYIKEFEKLKKHKYNEESLKLNDGKDSKNDNEISLDDLSKPKYIEIIKISKLNIKNIQSIKSEILNQINDELLEDHNFIGGYKKGVEVMEDFFKNRFKIYDKERNNPDVFALTNLSPWIHTGQISVQMFVLEANKRYKNGDILYTLMNEIFVWKETADHFVYHESNYDNINGALPWARESLKKHSSDEKKIKYSEDDLLNSRTKDKLWNAAQNELLYGGKIHGYVRMYWAKRILEWTKTPEEALEIAIRFNDTYSIDGNDSNGYLGIMWCICGSMDRAFGEREIFGKIRFMKAFKCPVYIKKWSNINK